MAARLTPMRGYTLDSWPGDAAGGGDIDIDLFGDG
jgi:hypothetical protein